MPVRWINAEEKTMDQDLKCPKCQSEMAQGFIPDRAVVSSWVEGKPEKAYVGYLKNVPPAGGIPIGAFRCASCGYLEFYADQKFAAQ
jgi:hypothetical protein